MNLRGWKNRAISFVLAGLLFFTLSTPQAGICRSPLASIIKISPPAPDLYKDLICTQQDMAYIAEIIISLSSNSRWELIWEEGRLSEIGAKIAHVHPLKFLSTVFTNANLKAKMPEIYADYFKRNGFMGNRLIGDRPADGLGSSLNREADKNKLNQYLNDFAKEINAPVEFLRPFVDARDWENLVRYLIQL